MLISTTQYRKRSYSDSLLETSVIEPETRKKRLDKIFAETVVNKDPGLRNRLHAPILRLPADIHFQIFQHVNPTPPENVRLQTVCRSFFHTLQHNIFWKDKTPTALLKELQQPGAMYRDFVDRGAASCDFKALYEGNDFFDYERIDFDFDSFPRSFDYNNFRKVHTNLWDLTTVYEIAGDKDERRAYDFTLALVGLHPWPKGLEEKTIKSFWAKEKNIITLYAQNHLNKLGKVMRESPELVDLNAPDEVLFEWET